MQLTTMNNTLFLLLSAYLFTYIDGLSIFNRILTNDFSQKQYWPELEDEENLDISGIRNNNDRRTTDNIPDDVYSQESHSQKDKLKTELDNKLYNLGALSSYYTQPSRQDLLNGASDLKPNIINCLEKVPEQVPSKSKKLCDEIYECFSSLPRISTTFARSLTIAIIPRCKLQETSKKSKRAPWAGAERRYDSMIDILRSRMPETKRSNSMSQIENYYNKDDEDIIKRKQKASILKSFPMSVRNYENSNGVHVKGYGHLPVAWYKKIATRSQNNRFQAQDLDNDQLFEGKYNVLKNKEKRMPENVADGGDSIYPLTDGTIGDFANNLALDTYASMLQQEYRQARADGTELRSSDRQIRPFVG